MELLPVGWITTEQARELTGYSIAHLYDLAQHRQVEAMKIGATWVFNQDSLLNHKATARPGPKKKTE